MTDLPPRQKIMPCLWFDKQAEEAVEVCVSVLPDRASTPTSASASSPP